jgi:type II secretory pathway pseudopilin PulG
MKPHPLHRGFTSIELAVLIVIVVIAVLVLPAMLTAVDRVHRTKDLTNARQIYLGLKLYAGDHNGQFPNRPPSADGKTTGVGALTNSNEAYNNICPTYAAIGGFYMGGSAWTPKPPDEAAPHNLQKGENHYAYVSGLKETDCLNCWPIIADGFAEGGESDGHYTSDHSAKGGLWKGQFAVVVRVDGTAAIMRCTRIFTVERGVTGAPGAVASPARNFFVQDTDPKNPWLSGTGVRVLNPL